MTTFGGELGEEKEILIYYTWTHIVQWQYKAEPEEDSEIEKRKNSY